MESTGIKYVPSCDEWAMCTAPAGEPRGKAPKMTNLTWKVSEEFDAILSPNGSSDGAYFSPGRPGQMGDHTTNIYNAINHFTNIRFGE